MSRVVLAPIITLFVATLTSAQEAYQARLAPPEIEPFPYISTYLNVYDGQGNFLFGLEPEDITILEDDQSLPVYELTQLRQGVQVVLAINPGSSFSLLNMEGHSRYDLLIQSLENWAQNNRGSDIDDLSLLAFPDVEALHHTRPEDFLASLNAFQPETNVTSPGLEILARALETAAAATARPGMGRAVLFITATADPDAIPLMQSLVTRASQRDVRLFIWLVGSRDLATSPPALALQELADQTGGSFFAYTGVDPIPDPEEYLEPLRNTYHLTYHSRITTSGTHRLAVQIDAGEVEITTLEQTFEIEVLPPNLAFVSPPMEIKRLVSGGSRREPEKITPQFQELEILIEFPDGYPRDIVRSILRVDGEIVAENITPPLDRFLLNLEPYNQSGTHYIQAEALDSLGFQSTSIELPLRVVVERPRQSMLMTISRNRVLFAGAAVAMAGSVLLLVLALGGRLFPGRVKKESVRRQKTDPVTQPVEMKDERRSKRLPGLINRLNWPQRRITVNARAFLIRLSETEEPKTGPPILITGDEITFGSDATQATHFLEDASVEALHARLRMADDGAFRLSDEGSVAGTWINYTPVSRDGARLEHGDLIHIGRVGFRFVLRQSDRIRKPTITLQEPKE